MSADSDELLSRSITVDSVALWLLRTGIDHSGKLSPNSLWEMGVRGAVLVDLRLRGNYIFDHHRIRPVMKRSGPGYLDKAMESVFGFADNHEQRFIIGGDVKVGDVAKHLVEKGEWRQHLSLVASSFHVYAEKDIQQYIPQRRRLAHILDGDIGSFSPAEASIARLGHALNVVRPTLLTRSDGEVGPPPHAGKAQRIVDQTIVEIESRASSVRLAAQNPAW